MKKFSYLCQSCIKVKGRCAKNNLNGECEKSIQETVLSLQQEVRRLEDENARQKAENAGLRDEIARLRQQQLSAISIDEIEQLLERYLPKEAHDLVASLNAHPVISRTSAWHDHYFYLDDKYLSRMKEYEQQQRNPVQSTVTTNNYNYASGATHNDTRQQVTLGSERLMH